MGKGLGGGVAVHLQHPRKLLPFYGIALLLEGIAVGLLAFLILRVPLFEYPIPHKAGRAGCPRKKLRLG